MSERLHEWVDELEIMVSFDAAIIENPASCFLFCSSTRVIACVLIAPANPGDMRFLSIVAPDVESGVEESGGEEREGGGSWCPLVDLSPWLALLHWASSTYLVPGELPTSVHQADDGICVLGLMGYGGVWDGVYLPFWSPGREGGMWFSLT